MTRAGTWKWTVPGLVLLAGCAALDDGPLPSLPDPPTVARFRPRRRSRWPCRRAGIGREVSDRGEPATAEPVVQVKADTPAPKSTPETLPPATDAAPATTAVPVSLDAVLRLAEDQNNKSPWPANDHAGVRRTGTRRQAHPPGRDGRHRLLAARGRHSVAEGPLIRSSTGAMLSGADIYAKLDLKAITFAKLDAARKTLQARGEAKRVTTEVLLEASSTYIDLLAAHSGLAIARNLDGELRKLLDRARKFANIERGGRRWSASRRRSTARPRTSANWRRRRKPRPPSLPTSSAWTRARPN